MIMFMSENNQEGIHLALLTILIADNTLPGFRCKYTHFTQNVMVFGYHGYNIIMASSVTKGQAIWKQKSEFFAQFC